MNVGTNIAKFRKEKKLTQEELACKINVSPKTISSYENNRNLPTIETLLLLSQTLDISIDEIIGKTNKDKNDTKEKYDKQRKTSLLIIFAISLFLLGIYCIHEFIVVYGLVSLSENFKNYFSIKDVIKLVFDNVLIYVVSVVWLYLIYYFKLNEKNITSTIIVSLLIIFLMAILIITV